MIEKLEQKIHDGAVLTPEEVCKWTTETPLDVLCEVAHRITWTYASHTFDTCSIINAKSGRCSENCKWCAQSKFYSTGVDTYPLVDADECFRHASLNERQGVKRFSLVTSGKMPTDKEIDELCNIFAHLHAQTNIHLCASLGLATEKQLLRLRQAGVQRYHCNLETAPSYFSKLCTSHTQEQKYDTIRAARRVGMDVCSGGIMGMGETMSQRIELAFTLKALQVQSIPLNILHPIKGTPMEKQQPLSEEDILRTVAAFRLVNPSAFLRFAGGRARLSMQTVKKALYTGINAAIVGDLLTTVGSCVSEDVQLVKEVGYEY